MKAVCENCCKTKEIEYRLTGKDGAVANFCSIGCVGEYAVELVGCMHDQYCLCFDGIYT
jgi:hypothetical protein